MAPGTLIVLLLCVSLIAESRMEPQVEGPGKGSPTRHYGIQGRARPGCGHDGGCYRGYCWSSCSNGLGRSDEWCYTTRSYSQSYKYIRCSSDSQCDRCLKCAGPCAAF